MPITVAIVEANSETRARLVALLQESAGVRCIGSYASGEDALQHLPIVAAQVALVDIDLPGMNGIECVASLASLMPAIVPIMLSTFEDSGHVFDSLRAGAAGYLLKKAGYAGLAEAIVDAWTGGAPMTAQVARMVVRHFQRPAQPSRGIEKLTAREQQLLALLARGYAYKEIAAQLSISTGTVITHVTHIYRKLGVQSRMQAAAKFFGQADRLAAVAGVDRAEVSANALGE